MSSMSTWPLTSHFQIWESKIRLNCMAQILGEPYSYVRLSTLAAYLQLKMVDFNIYLCSFVCHHLVRNL